MTLDSIHSPRKATLLSAIIPGAGQIYNNHYRPQDQPSKLWWKLPIIYGGLGASVYAAYYNHSVYQLFYTERKNRLDPNYTPQLYPNFTSDQLYPEQERFRQYRDYSIIGGLLVYVLNIIDANVEGHLLHFDVSDNLSLSVNPVFIHSYTPHQYGNFGFTIKLSPKS